MPTGKQPKPPRPRKVKGKDDQELATATVDEAQISESDVLHSEQAAANTVDNELHARATEAAEQAEGDSGLELDETPYEAAEEEEVLFSAAEIEAAEDVDLNTAGAEDDAAEEHTREAGAEEDEAPALHADAVTDEEAVDVIAVAAAEEEAAELVAPESEENTADHALVSEAELDASAEATRAVEAAAAEPGQGSENLEEGAEANGGSASGGQAPDFGAHDPGIDGPLAGEDEGEASALPLPPAFRQLAGGELMAAVEATFFMHHKPIGFSKLRELINPKIPEDDYRSAVSNLQASYFEDNRGLELAEVAGGFQLRTKPVHKDIMRRMFQIAPMKLTNAMLEVLAISAYNQPITREGIDRVRGVDSSHLVRVLLDKKMLRIVGKSDELGRPMLYGTTKEFLEVFGLRDLNSLPSLREIEDMLPKNEVGAEISEEEMLAREMEGIVENSKPLEFNDLELEELDSHETQKVSTQQAAPAQAHGDGSAARDASPEGGEEAGRDLHLPPEVAGRLPLGPEGNA